MDEDLDIDDIFGNESKKKKKVNGKKKGNRVELELTKKLTDHFGENFSRSVGSGARGSQVSNMPKHALETFIGDLCCPEHFLWVVECKGGYDSDVDFSSVFEGCSRIDAFIKQSTNDANTSKRLPIIMWKRSRKPWVAIFRSKDLTIDLDYSMKYRDWTVVGLDELLKKTDRSVWFETV